jgi:cytochrome c nitrite reductase small subunit
VPPQIVHRLLRVLASAPLPLALAVVIGIIAGVGSYTFRYARGLSYLSTDPAACVNCHIMQPQFDAWLHSSHRTAAVCVDCHLPEALIPKYATKAENGWRHGKLFTTQAFAEPIRVQEAGLAVLQENCVRCHDALVHELSPTASGEKDGVKCVHCHAGVGHGDRTGLGGPMRPAEFETHGPTASKGEPNGDDP